MRTLEEKEQELQSRQARIKEHYDSVIDRAPELTFFASRMETEKLGNFFLKKMYINMCTKGLSDLQVEASQKAYEELLAYDANGETAGTAPAPDGLTKIQGYVVSTARQQTGRRMSPNRARIMVRDDRGFSAFVTAPINLIRDAGTLHNLVGCRVEFTADLIPSKKDDTLAIQRVTSKNGIYVSKDARLIGNQFEEEEQ